MNKRTQLFCYTCTAAHLTLALEEVVLLKGSLFAVICHYPFKLVLDDDQISKMLNICQ